MISRMPHSAPPQLASEVDPRSPAPGHAQNQIPFPYQQQNRRDGAFPHREAGGQESCGPLRRHAGTRHEACHLKFGGRAYDDDGIELPFPARLEEQRVCRRRRDRRRRRAGRRETSPRRHARAGWIAASSRSSKAGSSFTALDRRPRSTPASVTASGSNARTASVPSPPGR